MSEQKRAKRTWTAEQKVGILSAKEADIRAGLNETRAIENKASDTAISRSGRNSSRWA